MRKCQVDLSPLLGEEKQGNHQKNQTESDRPKEPRLSTWWSWCSCIILKGPCSGSKLIFRAYNIWKSLCLKICLFQLRYRIVTNWGAAVLVYLIDFTSACPKTTTLWSFFSHLAHPNPPRILQQTVMWLCLWNSYQTTNQESSSKKVEKSVGKSHPSWNHGIDLSRFIGFGPSTKWRTLRCSYAKVAAAAPSKPTCDDLRGEVFFKIPQRLEKCEVYYCIHMM